MKKFIALILAFVVFAGFACGCTSGDSIISAVTGPTDVAAPGTKDFELTEVDISQFPDAIADDVYEWPTFGLAMNIPIPLWSNRGFIFYDSQDQFACDVGYTTEENFKHYREALQDAGFTINYKSTTYAYYGESENGVGVFINFLSTWSEMQIMVAQGDCLDEIREYVGY